MRNKSKYISEKERLEAYHGFLDDWNEWEREERKKYDNRRKNRQRRKAKEYDQD